MILLWKGRGEQNNVSDSLSARAWIPAQTGLFILQVPVHIILKPNIGSGAGTHNGIVFHLINSWVCVGIHIRLTQTNLKSIFATSPVICLLLQHPLQGGRASVLLRLHLGARRFIPALHQ